MYNVTYCKEQIHKAALKSFSKPQSLFTHAPKTAYNFVYERI